VAGDDDVWLAGTQAGHLRGGKLELLPFGSGTLYTCAAHAANDVWALGSDGTSSLVAHWDGKTLSHELLPYRDPFGIRAMKDGAVFLHFDQLVLQRVKGAWKQVAKGSSYAVSRGELALGSPEGKPMVALGAKKKAPPKPPVRLQGVYAVSEKDVWGVGGGMFLHWDGTAWKGGERIAQGDLMAVSGNSGGEVWAAGQGQLLRRKDGTWAKMAPPPTAAYGLYSASPKATWVAGNGVARWDGERWQTVDALKKESFRTLWGTGENDVWAVGQDAWHWDGKSWTKRESAEPGWVFTHIAGDGKGTTWLLMRGPRPETHDGRPTGLDDDVLEVSDGKPSRRIAPKDRPASIAYVAGGLWAVAGRKGLQRFDGKSWTEVKCPDDIAFTQLHELRGAPLLFGNDGAALRSGDAWIHLPRHEGLMTIDAWSDGAQLFAVGRDGLLLRWEPAK
jgi:hypothetical protein